jgi:transcriptional regulator with XRE-family HTH domain
MLYFILYDIICTNNINYKRDMVLFVAYKERIKVNINISKEKLAYSVESKRKKLDLSQEELGLQTGINRNTIGRIESGKFLPSIEQLNQLLDRLNLDFKDIVEEKKDQDIFLAMMGEAKTDQEKEWFEKMTSMILCIRKHHRLRRTLNGRT